MIEIFSEKYRKKWLETVFTLKLLVNSQIIYKEMASNIFRFIYVLFLYLIFNFFQDPHENFAIYLWAVSWVFRFMLQRLHQYPRVQNQMKCKYRSSGVTNNEKVSLLKNTVPA